MSESSLKRWADEGLINVSRTAGGHRRITIGEAIRFVRATGTPLVKPELLGLRDLSSSNSAALQPHAAAEQLFAFLNNGNAREARALVLSLYLQGQTVADIADGPIRTAMERLGEIWKQDSSGICIEHRATDICIQAVAQLKMWLEPRQAEAVAVGGAAPGDPYLLPSLLAATALTAEGWHVVNLGPDTPFEAMLHAIDVHCPHLVWMSISTIRDMAEVDRGVSRLTECLANRGSTLVLGGRALPSMTGLSRSNVYCCRSLREMNSISKAARGCR